MVFLNHNKTVYMNPPKKSLKRLKIVFVVLKPTNKVVVFNSVYLTILMLKRSPKIYMWVNDESQSFNPFSDFLSRLIYLRKGNLF